MMKCLRGLAVVVVLVLPVWAQAQILDFDSVCAAPPCPAMSLYAASGITITPPTTNVVAGGTDGLTGTNGVKYLYVATFPYQVSFGFNRVATYYSAVLSRATSSSGAVTVAVTALKNGVPVAGPNNVVLTTVNTWSPVVMNVPGGFDQIFMDPSGGANTTFGIDNVQISGNCFGFSDVQLTDSFCNAAEWLGNRGVTTGCAAGLYCPTNNVTRAQMALFMNRLGNTLTPTVVSQVGSVAGSTLSPAVYMCQTATVAAASYPRAATPTSAIILYESSAAKRVGARNAYSTDGGTTWIDWPSGFNFYLTASPVSGQWATLPAISPSLPLTPGVAYRFAIKVYAFSDTAPTVSETECGTNVQITNASSLTAPFDAPVMDQPNLR